MKTLIIVVVMLSATSINCAAQNIKNIAATQNGDKVEITYDLEDSKAGDYFIRAYASTDGGRNYNVGLSDAQGDVNALVKSGPQRKIFWNAMADIGEFQGMMRFKVIGLSTTALGRSENQNFVMGILDAKNLAKDKVTFSISLFCKSDISTNLTTRTFMTDNFGNIYKLTSGIIGTQSFGNRQSFKANDSVFGDLIFQVSKQAPKNYIASPSEFQLRVEFEGGGSLEFLKVLSQKQ
jgi:hypothetical protein